MSKSTANRLKEFSLANTDFTPFREFKGDVIVRDTLAVVFRPGMLRAQFVDVGNQYLIGEGRVLFVVSGSGRVYINMEEHRLDTGDILMVHPDSIVEPAAFSEDLDVVGVAFTEHTDEIVPCHLRPVFTDFEECLHLVHCLYEVASHEPFRRVATSFQLCALLANLRAISQDALEQNGLIGGTRTEELFRCFRKLVVEHAERERNIAFYADHLCITPHHLSSVVKAASGRSVMYWVNRAAILRAKIMLHTRPELSVADVAYAMDFPTPSAFCKFFRTHTGTSPARFRRES